jgi:hypothetical protein
MATVRYTFSLDALKDAGVVKWLDSQPNTSAAVREALKAYVEKPTNAELGAKLDEILNAIQTARWTSPLPEEARESQGNEPEAAIRGFDKMLGKFGA